MIKLDTKDKRILDQLDRNARQSNSQIARKVGLSERVVGYRISNLIERKIITGFVTKLNPKYLGLLHFKVYLSLQSISPKEEERFLKQITKHKNSLWVASTRGRWDIAVSILAEDIHEFTNVLAEMLKGYNKNILDKNIIILEYGMVHNRPYILNAQKRGYLYGSKLEKIELDKTDITILSAITKDSRVSLLELGRLSKLTPEAAKYRLKRLMKSGLIQEFGIDLDLGMLYYIVLFKLQNLTEDSLNKLISFGKYHKNILYIIKSIGNHGLEFEIEIDNHTEFNEIIKEIRNNFSNIIRSIETIEAYKEYKLDFFPMREGL